MPHDNGSILDSATTPVGSSKIAQCFQGSAGGFSAVVTFESDRGDPVVVRSTIVDSEPASAARKAVFRALPDASRKKWDSVVIVLTRNERVEPERRA